MARKKKGGAGAKAGAPKKGNAAKGASDKTLDKGLLEPVIAKSEPVLSLLGSVLEDDVDGEIAAFFAEDLALTLARAGLPGVDAIKCSAADFDARVAPKFSNGSAVVQSVLEFLADYDEEPEGDAVAEKLGEMLRNDVYKCVEAAAAEPEDQAGADAAGNNDGGDTAGDDDNAPEGQDGDKAQGQQMSKTQRKKNKRQAKKGGKGGAAADQADDKDLAPDAPKRPKGFVSILDRVRKGKDTMSNDIRVDKFDLGFNRNVLFSNADLHLIHGRKYGLVAPNGLGKSTLLRAIAARSDEFENIPAHFDIHYCEQEVTADDTTALEKVISADTERLRLLEEEKMMMEDDELYDGDLLTRIHDRLDEIEADSAEGRASAILSGLQFTDEMKKQATKDFSGGWRMRIALASALFRRPTLLLLDEPTNHLDLLAVIWLDNYLQKWKNTLLVVSHDQDFLNSVCTDIMHIEDQKLYYYKGAYDKFKRQHEEKLKADYKAWEQWQKARKQEKMQRGRKDDKKAVAKKAEKDRKAIAKKRERGRGGKKGDDDDSGPAGAMAEPPRPREYRVKFEFPEPSKLSIPIIQVQDAEFGYNETKTLFRDLDFGIDQDSRICLAGPNGAGKTTLLKLMWGELAPTKGEIHVNRKLIVGKYSQHAHEQLELDLTPIEYLLKKFGHIDELEGMGQQQAQQHMRKLLGRYGLPGEAHTRTIGSISGGQKARVALVEVSLMHPHILFFDEPTNHLDIESIDALIDGLRAFEGGVIVVSHDARLITELDCDLWIVGDEKCTPFPGDFDDYRDELVDKFEEHEREMEELRAKMQEERRRKREEEKARRDKQMRELRQKQQEDKTA